MRPVSYTTRLLTYGSDHIHGLLLDGRKALQIERDNLHCETKRVQVN